MKITNEGLWGDIESLPTFASSSEDDAGCKADKAVAWHWLEKLQQGSKLRAVDLIQLKALLEVVYTIGFNKGVDEANE